MTPDSITCRDLTKRFGATTALDALNLSVPAGSVFGFLGPNGAGKSTTIRMLVTLTHPTSGDAEVAGSSVTGDPDGARRAIGYLPQDPAFPGWMSGREYLRFQAGLISIPGATQRQQVEDVLSLVSLTDVGKRRVGGYSGGMKQRLGIAQALLGRPSVLILDEPISALDPLGRRDIIDLIEQLRGQTTVFFSSHILADIEGICDRVAILDRGKLLVEETMTGLKDRYAQPAFEIDVTGDASELTATLRRMPWVQNVDHRGGHLRVLVSDVARAEATLPRAVLDAGLTLVRYEQALPSLEDIFVRLVGHAEGDL
jgi:ABC-2 type transport system ATP-binding protein